MYGIGKKTALNVLKRGLEKHQSLLFVGTDDIQEAVDAAGGLVALCYDQKGRYEKYHNLLNGLRAALALHKSCEIAKLPPSEASFKQHVERANYQVKIWINAHKPKPTMQSPIR